MPFLVGDDGGVFEVTQVSDSSTFAPPAAQLPGSGQAALPQLAIAATAGAGVTLDVNGHIPPSAAATALRMLGSDPAGALTGEFWYRTDLDKLSVQTAVGVKRSAVFV